MTRFSILGMAMLTLEAAGCVPRGASAIAPDDLHGAWRRTASIEMQPTEPSSPAPQAEAAQIRRPSTTGQLPSGLEPEVEPRPWRYIIVHHTATATGDVAAIDEEHQRRTDQFGNPWLGIGYHFVIGNGRPMADGVIEPTFRWRDQLHGAHAGSQAHNDLGIGVCLVGDFTQEPPTERQIAATIELLRKLSQRFEIPSEQILRHGDVSATECPGEQFPWDRIVEAISPDESLAAKSPRNPTPSGAAARTTGLDHITSPERALRR